MSCENFNQPIFLHFGVYKWKPLSSFSFRKLHRSLIEFHDYELQQICCKLAGVPMAADGMDTAALERVLQENPGARFIYTIPNFQNPSGATMSLEKRQQVYALAKQYGVLILEDNPYGDLRVAGEPLPTIKSMDTDGIVIYAGSFSKILSPGLRVAYCVGPKPVLAKMTVGKQAEDVHTAMLNQMIVYQWFRQYDVDAHIEKIRGIYRKKLELMCNCIDSDLGDFVEYVRPQGGLFIWCKLPGDVDMLDFCKRAIAKQVAVVPGNAFGDCGEGFIRVSYCYSIENIKEAVTRIGEFVKELEDEHDR